MEQSTPVRKPHTSTSDLLTWSEIPPTDSAANSTPYLVRNVQVLFLFPSLQFHFEILALCLSASDADFENGESSDGISKVVFGGQVTDEEVESLIKSDQGQ